MNQARSSRTAWLLLLFLTLLNVLNFVDRQLIVSLGPVLIHDLKLKITDLGWLYGYIFLVFYTVMGLLMATIADRWNRQRLIAGGLALWSALTAASGAATSFLHLAMARMLVGIGEATLTPAALSILSDAFPSRQRALASGLYYAGVPLGSGLSLIIAGWMTPRYGWRNCFYVLGILGLILMPLVLLIKTPRRGAAETETPPSGAATSSEETAQSASEIYRSLFATLHNSPALWLSITAAILLNLATAAGSLVITWLSKERGMEYGPTAITNGLIVTIAGLLGTGGSGAISDWFQRRWSGGRLWYLVVKAIVLLPFIIGFYTLPVDVSYRLFYVCWFIATFSSLSWYGPIFATVQDLAPLKIRATAVAFLMLAINIVGTGLGVLIPGWISQSYSLRYGLMTTASIGYVALIPLFFAARRYQTDLVRAREAETINAAAPTLA